MTAGSLTHETPGFRPASVARQRVALLASLFILFAFAECLFWLGSAFEQTPWWVSVIIPAFLMSAAVKCFRTMTRLTGNERKGWLYFGLACLVYAAAEAVWGIYDSFLGIANPSPSIADIGYLACPLLFILGIGHYHVRAPSRDETFVRLGDLGIILSATPLIYLFAYAEFLRTPIAASRAVIAVAYGILDLSAPLFALIVLAVYTWGRRRHVMLLILLGLCFHASTDFTYIAALMGAGFQTASLINGLYLIVPLSIIWAAFEQDQLGSENPVDEPLSESKPQVTHWETLLPPLAVAGVFVVALVFRERLSAILIPYVIAASTLFISSLATRNWWGHRLETRLRSEALQSKSDLQTANRELRHEMDFRTRVQEQLRQSQKMEALGQLTGGVAHDFNNLLAVILGNLELLEGQVALGSNQREFLRDAASAAERGSDLTQRLLSFSRKQALRAEPIEVNAFLDEMKILLRRTLGERTQVKISVPQNMWLCLADRAQLENAILNLAINARDAMPDGGELQIEASNATLDQTFVAEHPDTQSGAYVSISVRDTGVGISTESLSRVFDPFFTTKEVGSGTGLGLSMVYGFAKQSGGHVTIESRAGSGTQVTLYLPCAEVQAQVPRVQTETRASTQRGSGESILLVEDEPAVRKLVTHVLGGLGYRITEAQDGAEALRLLEGIHSLDLLLSDVVLPGKLSGRDLAAQIERKRPGTPVLLMSGYASDVLLDAGDSHPIPELLHKPFRTAELARKVRSVLDPGKPRSERAETPPPSNSQFGGAPPS